MRLHTFQKGNFKLWADRVPVMHGEADLFTLWRLENRTWKRVVGGVQMPALRRAIQDMADQI